MGAGVEGIEKYNDINKVEPMNRALKSRGKRRRGLRVCVASSPVRARIYPFPASSAACLVLPIIDWDNRTVYQYPQSNGLKYLIRCGIRLSVGMIRTPPANGSRVWRKKRHAGLKRECGLHEG
ncbi:phosphoadenosine phosphosulfate reductase family protein [Salmonella enterica subsp. enterica]|nr:phosphoadenosine phosphosulfate reductase family protein [Salmonella enterica subsp. enterica]